jgi:xanthine dehydrogenase small subunit
MSLFHSYHQRVCPAGGKGKGKAQGTAQPVPTPMTREQAQQDLSGNLCRCTGYRPLLDAAQRMSSLPPVGVDHTALRRLLEQVQAPTTAPANKGPAAPGYLAPTTLEALLQARHRHPNAQVVAGCTDVGLWINKGHQRYAQVLDVTRAAELRAVERYPHHLALGAAVNLEDAYAALVAERPQLAEFAHRFAGLPVRHSGTLGGNIANGSPIGDSMPLLLALGASLVLMRWNPRGKAGQKVAWRELALDDFYTGYRQNVLRPDELLAWVKVPRPTPRETLRAYKVSKRFDDDISAVCLALNLQVEGGVVRAARLGAGGVAATPVRARQTEAALLGQPWNETTALAAAATLQAEFQPISDMRASAAYRRTVLGGLVQRFWLETSLASSAAAPLRLTDLQMLGVAP